MHVSYRCLDSPYKYFLSIPQPESEDILLQYFLDLGGMVDFDAELIGINNSNSECVEVLISQHGIINNHITQYLIGCDGAKSKVRAIVGSEFVGKDYGIFFELIDVHLDWNGNKNACHYFVAEDCFVIIIPMTENKHRIVIKNNINDIEQIKAEKSIFYYENIIRHCGVINLTINSILWHSSSKFYNKLIDNYSYENRIFFAGDACHLFSPIGGLVMNTGLQDAFNLSWRLSGVLSGKYNAEILEEYNCERRFIGDKLLQSTDASTELITRINKQNNAVVNWLPLMQNRNNIKHKFPLNFSGLSHNYMLNGKEIYHVPFARGIYIVDGKEMCTYDMVDGIHFNILLFANQIENTVYSILIDELSKYDNNLNIWQITNDNSMINTNVKQQKQYVIFDKYGELYNKFAVNGGCDVIVIRPDGYVGLACVAKEFSILKTYLKYYFVQSGG